MPAITLIAGIGTSLGYVILLAYAVWMMLRFRGAWGWLALLVLLGLAGAVARLSGRDVASAISVYCYSAALIVFGALTLDYLKLSEKRIWLAAGGVWLLLVIVTDVWNGAPALGVPGWLRTLAHPAASPAGWLALVGWLVLGMTLFLMTVIAFYRAHLPEVANRALYWMAIVPVLLVGILLAASGIRLLVAIGLIVSLAGTASAAYAMTTLRVFDLRRVLRHGFALFVTILATATVILVVLLVAGSLPSDSRSHLPNLIGLALAAAALYVPARRLAGWMARRVFADSSDPAHALRHYSQRVAAVIDLEEVGLLATQTLLSVLRARPGGLLLVSETQEEQVTVEPVSAGSGLPQERGVISKGSAIYTRLFVQQAPLLQFDLEFNRDYTAVPDVERAYFQRLRMSAYAPILMDGQTIGILAGGARLNDQPYRPSDLEMLATIASQTGIALRNARMVTDLRRLNDELETANVDFERLDRVKTDFITIASHELRTPLAQIRGYTDMIEILHDQQMLDPEQMESMTGNLRKAAERMEELISDMLDVSKLDVNAMDLHFSQTAMETVIRLAIDPLTDAIRARKIGLSARGLRDLPPIEADLKRLVQAFRNVIVNAVKYTPDEGLIDIRARLDTEPGQGDVIHVEIADTGIGIAAEHQELIFEKFFRVGDPSLHSTGATKFMGAGPGLGLTIARGMIEGHGGRIWVESPGYDPQRFPGSTFHIVLPLVPPEGARHVLPFDETKLTLSPEKRAELLARAGLTATSFGSHSGGR